MLINKLLEACAAEARADLKKLILKMAEAAKPEVERIENSPGALTGDSRDDYLEFFEAKQGHVGILLTIAALEVAGANIDNAKAAGFINRT